METFLHLVFAALVTTVAWFIAGAALYMNPFTARIYKKHSKHASMRHFPTQGKYLAGVFLIAGLVPIILSRIAYDLITPIGVIGFWLLLAGVRIIPRLCDMWMQTSYPEELLLVELANGIILSFVTAFMFSVL